MEPKKNNTSSHMLLDYMNLVCCCSLLVWRKSFLKKGTPLTYFCLTLDPPLGRCGRNILMHVQGHEHFIPTKFRKNPLRFCHRSNGRYGFEKICQAVLCPTQLFHWKLICTFNQHCLSYKISNRLQFNSSLFPHKLFKMLLHWHTFFQHVPHVENTFKYTNTYAYVFFWPV